MILFLTAGQQIQAGEFVELWDLLADNISLHNQLEDFHGQSAVNSHSSLSKAEGGFFSVFWVYCFFAYIAVLAPDACTWELGLLQANHPEGLASWRVRLAGIRSNVCWQETIDAFFP